MSARVHPLDFWASTATVANWAYRGRLRWIVLPGGHRRYDRSDVARLAGEMARRAS